MTHNKKDAKPAVRQASLSGAAAAVPSWPVPAHPRSKRRPAPVARGRTNARAAPAPAATPRSRGDRVERSMGQSMGQRLAWSRKGSQRKRIRKGEARRGETRVAAWGAGKRPEQCAGLHASIQRGGRRSRCEALPKERGPAPTHPHGRRREVGPCSSAIVRDGWDRVGGAHGDVGRAAGPGSSQSSWAPGGHL